MKILAIADTHISERMTLGGASPTVDGEALVLVQSRRTMSWIAQVALEHRVDLIVHAGDVYESARPTPAEEAVAVAAFIELSEVAPVVVLAGNHDRPKGGGVCALEPLRHVAPTRLRIATDPTPIFVERREGYGARFRSSWHRGRPPSDDTMAVVFPLPFPERSRVEAQDAEARNGLISLGMEQILAAHAQQARMMPVPTVVAMHGTMRGASFGDRVAPLSDIAVPVVPHWMAFDVHIAGHIHQRQRAPGTVLPGYVGAPDRMSFGEASDTSGVSLFELTTRSRPWSPCDGPSGEQRRHGRVVETHIPNPQARRYETIDLGAVNEETDLRRLLLTDGADALDIEPDETVYRVRGELLADEHQAVAAALRSLRAKRVIVANETTVRSSSVARTKVDGFADGDVGALVDAVLDSRPDLAEDRELILDGLAAVMP